MKQKTTSKIIAVIAAVLLIIPISFGMISPSKAEAAITPDSRGMVTINDVQDGETFTATRFINTVYDGVLSRSFAPGFSYGTHKTEYDGLNAYVALTETGSIARAVEQLSSQITDQSESYTTEARDGKAVFTDLPMGQYIITGVSNNPARAYVTMLGTVEPVVSNGEYSLPEGGVTIDPKTEPVKIAKPILEVSVSADKEYAELGDTVAYKVVVAPAEGSSDVQNIHIRGGVDDVSAQAGMVLNKDIKVTDKDGNVIENAVIAYTELNGSVVGFTIDIPGTYPADSQFVIEYSGSTANMTDEADIRVAVQAWCTDFENPVGSEHIVKVVTELPETDTPQNGVAAEEDIDDEMTPLERLMEIIQTGDIIPYAIGGMAVIALIVVLVVAWKRKKEE